MVDPNRVKGNKYQYVYQLKIKNGISDTTNKNKGDTFTWLETEKLE